MISLMPTVILEDDAPARPMAQNGALLGFSPARAVWRFGFKPGSDIARAFGVSSRRPMYVLAMHQGRVLETLTAAWGEPVPGRLRKVLGARL